MPVVYPVSEKILQVMFNRLLTMDDISGVVRETRNVENWTPEDRQVLLTHMTPTRTPALDCPGNPPALAYTMQVNCRCHILNSETSSEPVDTALHIMAADVVKKVTGYPTWYQVNGLAINTEIGDIEKINFDGGFDAVNVPFLITYRVSEVDPYEQR